MTKKMMWGLWALAIVAGSRHRVHGAGPRREAGETAPAGAAQSLRR